MTAPQELGPAQLAVLIARLTGVAHEMGEVLRRAAFSPNIKERADCSAALFTADGTLLVQAEHIPVHLGSMPASVAAAIEAWGDRVGPHDQIILNDPFAGGTHLNDITLVAPVFVGGSIIGWVANRAHHADLGGTAPGSMPADAVHIDEEGLRLAPVLLTPEVAASISAASRTPDERTGDLDAQVGANRLGAERFAALGADGVSEIVAYGERRMRAALAELPDGTWTFADVLDSFGPAPDQQQPTRITVQLTVDGDRIRFDFTGTDPQREGNVNAVEAVTVSAVAWALRSVLDPTIPANGGALRSVEVVAPAGTVVAARYPAAVGAGNVEVSQRVADVCLGALAQVVPDRVPAASQGTMNNLLLGGDGWVSYETIAGGQGGRPPRPGSNRPPVPGMSGVHTAMTNTRNTPIEAFERAYAVRVLRYRLRRGSGGAGAADGGEGIERDLQVLEPVTVSLITERRRSQPWGLAGGGDGATGENWLLPAGDEARAERLPDKCTIHLAAGDVILMRTPGGGALGPTGLTPAGPAETDIGGTWEHEDMDRSVACRFDASIDGTVGIVLSVAVAADASLASEDLSVTIDGAPVDVQEVVDQHGTRLHVAPALGPGRLDVAYTASISGPGTPMAIDDVDLIRYTRPSRYCESDRLAPFARAEFGSLKGQELLDAVSSWVGMRLVYIAGSSRPTDGAVATLLAGQGVCRDYAHLVVAILRACDHPARLASVYAPGLQPMDFHAVAEAYVDGRWEVVDATCLAPRTSMVRIATGRDAADTAFLTSTGDRVDMGWLEVMAITDGPLPDDDMTQPVQLG